MHYVVKWANFSTTYKSLSQAMGFAKGLAAAGIPFHFVPTPVEKVKGAK